MNETNGSCRAGISAAIEGSQPHARRDSSDAITSAGMQFAKGELETCPPYNISVLVTSDRAASGERPDATGPALREFIEAKSARVVSVVVVPDERRQIADTLREMCNVSDLVLTAGGTGLAARDVTPEATAQVIERSVPGIAEAMRAAGLRKTSHAMLSRGIVGVRGQCLIINLPGSPKAAMESLEAVWEALPHAVAVLRGPVTDASHLA